MSYNLAVEVWRQGEIKDLLNKFFPKFIYCTNRIANSTITFIDVETAFKYRENENFEVNNRSNICVQNHITICKNILKIIKENKSKLSIDLIKYLHNELMKNCFTEEVLIYGQKIENTKNSNGVITSRESEQRLNLLIKDINSSGINENNALIVVSYLCGSFEEIKPFAYGNGVVIRLIINYLLIGNYLPPIVLFESDRESYCLALEYFNDTQETTKMVSFLEDQSYKTWFKNYNLKVKTLKEFL